jgi:putative endonuclease
MFWIYAVYNEKHKKFYIGQTENLEQRLLLHNTAEFKNSYTSRFGGNWVLIYKESVQDRIDALKREKQLKSFRGREFIKNYMGKVIAGMTMSLDGFINDDNGSVEKLYSRFS